MLHHVLLPWREKVAVRPDEGERESGVSLQSSNTLYCEQHWFQVVSKQIVIRDSKHLITLILKKLLTLTIVCTAVSVALAIHLDGDPFLKANEVNNKRADRHLPSKFHPHESPVSQQPPENPFWNSLVLPQFF